MEIKAGLYLDNCKTELKNLANNSIDLIFTSLTYADQRKTHTVAYILANTLISLLPINGNQLLTSTQSDRDIYAQH